jgi:uncharacterized glyoxalase superfamily protein PhnB
MAVKSIPDGYHSLTPYLFTKGAPGLIDFITKTFDAKEMHCITARTARCSTRSTRLVTHRS